MAKAATEIRRAILERAKTHPRIAYLAPFNAGVFGPRHVRAAPNGWPDLAGYTRDGRAVFLEIKSATDDKRNVNQATFLATAREFGCIAGYVRSVQDFEKLLG